jgi:hypothetical protein
MHWLWVCEVVGAGRRGGGVPFFLFWIPLGLVGTPPFDASPVLTTGGAYLSV